MTNKLILSAILALGVTAGANAQLVNYSSSIPVSVTVAEPITMTVTTPLSFGVYAVSNTLGGTAALSAVTGGVTVVGGVTRLSSLGVTTAAQVSVTGGPGYSYSVTAPVAGVTLNRVTGGGALSLANIAIPGGGALTLDGSGNGSFGVGGEITFGANQAAGAYTGSFAVTANYN
jgi:hypothetical protein